MSGVFLKVISLKSTPETLRGYSMSYFFICLFVSLISLEHGNSEILSTSQQQLLIVLNIILAEAVCHQDLFIYFLSESHFHWNVFTQTAQIIWQHLTGVQAKTVQLLYSMESSQRGYFFCVTDWAMYCRNTALLCCEYLWCEMFCYKAHWSIYRNGFLSAEGVC